MISDFKELELLEGAGIEKWDAEIKEKLGIQVIDLQNSISEYVKNKAEELSLTFVNIAPMGDYGLLLEDNDSMTDFLRTEASKAEYWKLMTVIDNPNNHALLQFTFLCTAVDDGDVLKGHVFVSKSGIIRHAFAQNNS